MKKILILILTLFIFNASNADILKIKDNFFSSIESFLDGNFDDTDFSIKSTEGLKPQIGILTFKPLNDTDYGLTFFQGSEEVGVTKILFAKSGHPSILCR